MKLLHEHSICSAKAAAYNRVIEPGKFLPVLLLLFLSMVILLLPVSAQAAISLTVSGDGVSNPRTFSEADLLDMELVQQQYSTINTHQKDDCGSGGEIERYIGASGNH
jgi:hypothetical protein